MKRKILKSMENAHIYILLLKCQSQKGKLSHLFTKLIDLLFKNVSKFKFHILTPRNNVLH